MRSEFSIAGHPLHPMLVALPVGLLLWTFAAFLLMFSDRATAGALLIVVAVLQGVAAVGLVAIAGWLGGEMVFHHHLGMIPDDAVVGASEQTRHAWRAHHA